MTMKEATKEMRDMFAALSEDDQENVLFEVCDVFLPHNNDSTAFDAFEAGYELGRSAGDKDVWMLDVEEGFCFFVV